MNLLWHKLPFLKGASSLTSRKTCMGLMRFTLIEMLVVIAIICVLLTLLVPAAQKAVESARAIGCLNNMRQIYLGFSSYSDDHYGLLPPPKIKFEPPFSWNGKSLTAKQTWVEWPSQMFVGQYLGVETLLSQPDAGAAPPVIFCTEVDYRDRTFNSQNGIGVSLALNTGGSWFYTASGSSIKAKWDRFQNLSSPSKVALLADSDMYFTSGNYQNTLTFGNIANADYLMSNMSSPSNFQTVTANRHGGSCNMVFADGSVRTFIDILSSYMNNEFTVQ